MINPELRLRAAEYAEYADLSGLTLDWARPLGNGTDGAVWKSPENTAVKVLERERGYYNERDAYLRLADYGFSQQINEFWIPSLLTAPYNAPRRPGAAARRAGDRCAFNRRGG